MTGLLFVFLFATAMRQAGEYQCMPCGGECDKAMYNKPGDCPHCNMNLVKKSSVVFNSIQPADLCSYIAKHPDVVLLDVRTREEFEGKTDDYGTIKNAINIPVLELANRVSELNAFKEKEIIVYCSHSRRSPRASYLLNQNGFKRVTNLEGGMSTMKDKTCKK